MWLEFLLFCVLLLVYAVVRDRRPRNCPPGPFEIPFIGCLPIIDERTPEKYRRKYGDIVMYRTPLGRAIVLFDPTTAREVLSRPDFADRPAFVANFSVDEEKLGGVIFSNGAHWQHDRRFVLRNLRNLGMGRSYLGDAINTEAKALVEDLKTRSGEAIDHPDSFRTAVLNIIWQMVASIRYDLHSTEVDAIYKMTAKLQSNASFVVFLPIFFPVLKRLPKSIRNSLLKENLVKDVFNEIKKVVVEAIDKHLEDFDLDNPRDLIDEYVKEMKENEGNEESLFRMGALIQIVTDLFHAGSDTLNTMLKWVVFLLARYPHYARRMQEEIDEVVPKDRMVSWEDKPSLPLVDAFLTEVLRYSSLAVLNVERSATRDTTIGGYFVPKDTILQTGNYYIHYDPRYWDDPHRFYPERFLDESGTKYTAPTKAFFAFGAGRRQCAGEMLARMVLFLFSAAIIQHFDVLPPAGVNLNKVEIKYLLGGIRAPAAHKLVYRIR